MLSIISFFVNSLSLTGAGTSIQQLTVPMLKTKLIPLPPLSEQALIVSKLDALFDCLDKLDSAQKKFLHDKEIFRKSILKAAFEGNWELVRLGDIGQIVGGGTPDTSHREYWDSGDIAWITPADMSQQRTKYISHGRRNITEKGLASSSARILPKGSVIFSSRAPIGYVAIAENDLCTSQGCKSVKFSVNVSPEYIYYALLAMREKIQRMGSGTTFKEVSGKVFGSVTIPLPPLEEQRRIVKRLDELMHVIDSLSAS